MYSLHLDLNVYNCKLIPLHFYASVNTQIHYNIWCNIIEPFLLWTVSDKPLAQCVWCNCWLQSNHYHLYLIILNILVVWISWNLRNDPSTSAWSLQVLRVLLLVDVSWWAPQLPEWRSISIMLWYALHCIRYGLHPQNVTSLLKTWCIWIIISAEIVST